MRPRSALFPALAAAFLAPALLADCKKPPSVDLTLGDPCGLRSDAACDPKTPDDPDGVCGERWCTRSAQWVEMAIFPGACPSDDLLVLGDTTGALFHEVVPVGVEISAPGDLDQKGFGFAAFLRGEDCGVVGYGCTNADLSRVRSISVRIDPSDGSGACAEGSACVGGMCVAGGTPGDGGKEGGDGGGEGGLDGGVDANPDAGTSGCDLALVASGKLPDAVAANATEIGPALAATNDGFLLAWREVDAPASESHLFTLPLGDDGAVGTPHSKAVELCPDATPPGGLGLAFATNQQIGLAVTARTDCNDAGAGATFLALNSDGTVSTSLDVVGAGTDLSLAPTHAVSTDGTGTAFQLGYVSAQTANRLDVVAGSDITLSNYVGLLSGEKSTFASVASSADVRAALADRAVDGGSQTVLGYGPWDGGAPKTTVLDAGAPAALAAWSKRVIAVARGANGLAWDARTSDGAALGAGTLGTGTYGAVDVGVANDHVVVAAGASKAITLFHIDGTSMLASGTKTVTLGPTVGTVSLASFDGKNLALAAARDRVAIAWTTSRKAASTGPIGGWALLACKP